MGGQLLGVCYNPATLGHGTGLDGQSTDSVWNRLLSLSRPMRQGLRCVIMHLLLGTLVPPWQHEV